VTDLAPAKLASGHAQVDLARAVVGHAVPVEDAVELRDRQGAPEQVALGRVATDALGQRELGDRLDPLGHEPEAQRTTQLGDRTEHPLVALHERAVELELGHGQRAHPGQ